MPANLRSSFTTCLLGAIVGVVSLAPGARAADKPLSSGLMIAANSGNVTTSCNILNFGSRPVTISSTSVLAGPNGQAGPPTSDDCSSAPLDPNGACNFGTAGGVYGGGTAFVSMGNPKHLRGNCRLVNGSGVVVQILPMR